MSGSRSRGSGGRPLAACLVAALALSGCGLHGGPDRQDPEWVHDPQAERYFRPGLLMQGPELLEEHFPEVADASPRRLTEGRFTDPAERVPIPAPDDYWWQAVVQLSAEQAAELRSDSADDQAGGELGAVPESEVLSLLVPTLESELVPCEGEWASVLPALAGDQSPNVSEAGDLIELAVVCESSEQLVTSATDM